MSRFGRIGLLLAIALSLAPFSDVQAQTTGRIFGEILDAQGAVVPGATVTVTSPALQGSLVQTTDGEGRFRFLSLPPGRYTLKAELASFKTVEQSNIEVGLDRTVNLPLRMEVAGIAETVTVTEVSPVIDQTSTVTGINVGPDLFNRLPVRRDFYAVTRLSPGVTQDRFDVGPNVYGSTGAENQYIIDGLNTTGVELGTRGKTFNMDFIQEVEVKTGGLPAEYGRTTGGIVNAITKSGSNAFRGSGFGFAEGGVLQADNSTRDKLPEWRTTVADEAHRADVGGELGGFIIKDRLWFFGALNYQDRAEDTTVIRTLTAPGSPAVDSVIPATIKDTRFAAKFTGRISNGQTLNASVLGDPTRREGNIFAISGPESTWKGERKTGGTDALLKYDGVFGGRFLLSGKIARHFEKEDNFGLGREIPQLIDLTVTPTALSGGFGFFQDQEFTRNVYKVDATRFFGGHDLKAGVDFEHMKAVNKNFNGGAGQRIYKLSTGAGGTGTVYYRHRFFIDDRAPGYVRSDPRTWTLSVPLASEPDSRAISFYVQDGWKVASYLTVNAGIRWEGQDVRDRDGTSAFKLNDNWAPRLGVIWDVARNNRSKLYANWGRFFENIPMDINIRAFGGEISCFCYNFSPDAATFLQDPAAPRAQSLLGGSTEPVDPDLKGQYLDELLVGFEYELRPNLVVGAKLTRRDLGRVIEDFLIPSEGNYFIANPAQGIGTEMAFYDGVHTASAPKTRRESTAFELTAQKRFSNNWQFLGSVVFGRLEGNYDGLFQLSTGQLDPNINSAFDYADFLVNADGKLTNDRNVQLKLDGSYEFSNGRARGLNLGVSTRWLSGTPLNAYGYSIAYQNWEYYLVPRGSVGRGPADWETDLQLSYPIRFAGERRLSLIADIFNLFNRQSTMVLDERYNLPEHGTCGGIPDAICNGDGGIATTGNNLTPAGTISDPRATASNPDYLRRGVLFTGQRSLRFGVKFLF